MKLTDNIISEVKNINLVDVIGRYVKLKKRGSEYVGLCPFHDESTPSFYVDPNKGYKCFGCEKSGANAIDFLIDYEKIDFVEAVKRLSNENGVISTSVKPTIRRMRSRKAKKVDYIHSELLTAN